MKTMLLIETGLETAGTLTWFLYGFRDMGEAECLTAANLLFHSEDGGWNEIEAAGYQIDTLDTYEEHIWEDEEMTLDDLVERFQPDMIFMK